LPNIQNHAIAIGHLSLEEHPFDELDALILSQLVYLPLEGFFPQGDTCTIAEAGEYIRENVAIHPLDTFQKKRYDLFEACAELPRYAYWQISGYKNEIDNEKEMQFCACTYLLPNGSRCIAYRGTDMTLVGWKEDFNMSYTTVPSQQEAAEYIQKAAAGHGDALYLCGHSKGGNLAVYAAATTDASTRERIRRVYSFDAPGVDEQTLQSDGYALISERIESYLPQSSIVGMLLNYHPVYTVVKSSTLAVLQHDTMTWQVRDGAFVTLPGLDSVSRITDEAVHTWLASVETEERRFLVDTLYRVVASSQADLLTDLVDDWKESANRMLDALRGLNVQERKFIRRMLRSLFATGANEVVEIIMKGLTRRDESER
jgi:pimeloyl-ACP methyl ester carboxylesterase